MQNFPEYVLVSFLIITGIFWYAYRDKVPPISVTVEVPSTDAVGTCRVAGRYWVAKKQSDGSFRCFLKDAP